MPNLVVYTAIFGNYDTLQAPLVINDEVDYVCFTDRLMPEVPPWQQVVVRRFCGTVIRDSHRLKILSHRLFPDATYTLWIDGQARLNIDPMDAIDWLEWEDIAVYRHPLTDCVYEEAKMCLALTPPKRTPALVEKQVEAYRALGMETKQGMTACTVILRRHTDDIVAFNEAWWEELCKHSAHDQLSFWFLVHGSIVGPAFIPGHLYDKNILTLVPHARGSWDVEREAAVDQAMKVEGRIERDELGFLYDLAMLAEPGRPLVELGTFFGRSATLLGSVGARLGSRVITIDNYTMAHDRRPGFETPEKEAVLVAQSIADLGVQVEAIPSDSSVVPDGLTEIGFLFIDSSHLAVELNKELDVWLPLLGSGGVLTFHDYALPGCPEIKPVVDRRIVASREWGSVGMVRSVIGFVGKEIEMSEGSEGLVRVSDFQDGTFVRDPDRTIYFVQGGKVRPIMNATAFFRYGVSGDAIVEVSLDEIEQATKGEPIL